MYCQEDYQLPIYAKSCTLCKCLFTEPRHLLRSSLFLNAPFRPYRQLYFATLAVIPEIYFNKERMRYLGLHLQYLHKILPQRQGILPVLIYIVLVRPTPIDFGSILTSSANDPAISSQDTAPLRYIQIGNSSFASRCRIN